MDAKSPRSGWLRVRDIRADLGVSKPWVFARLKSGDLEAVKLDGVLLISRESYERYVSQATPWEPRK